MIHISKVELSHFKSFGGTVEVPLLPGFTVVTGPNGSGKSNILDGLLFALGLSSSKGMRADRLPDLVNQNHVSRSRSTVETIVSATFAIDPEDLPPSVIPEEDPRDGVTQDAPREWVVTRKLRVTPQGTYTSTYYSDGEPCTLTQLHEQLNRLRIYPEGYNIVLQGDVTGIISMNSRERRQIIDELAGVAQFDRKIDQAKEKLGTVKEREDRCRIIEQELREQLQRLDKDRQKAEKYQQLRQELHTKETWETVLGWRLQSQELAQLRVQIQQGDRHQELLKEQYQTQRQQGEQLGIELEALNQRVKALGEEELLGFQSQLATSEAEYRQLHRQLHQLREQGEQTQGAIQETQGQIQRLDKNLRELAEQITPQENQIVPQWEQRVAVARQELQRRRSSVTAVASESQEWVQAQSQRRQALDQVLAQLEPQRAQRLQLQERWEQLQTQIHGNETRLHQVEQDYGEVAPRVAQGQAQYDRLTQELGERGQRLAQWEQELGLQRETQQRLLREQREKQRLWDKQESLQQALQETQGTQATRLILQGDIPGVLGLVAQLGQVDAPYQLALEVAAGGRLGYVVVEDDGVAAAGIALLKHQRAGRATFLPLNRIRPPAVSFTDFRNRDGFIDYAVHLIRYDDRYHELFQYVLGNTLVFESLDQARRCGGQHRIVTLEGDLIEGSGAITGGSVSRRPGSLRFGQMEAAESAEMQQLRQRLQELDEILDQCDRHILQQQEQVRQESQALTELRQAQQAAQWELQQGESTLKSLGQQRQDLAQNLQEQRSSQAQAHSQIQSLDRTIPDAEHQAQILRQHLQELEASPIHGEWQARQRLVEEQEQHLQEEEQALKAAQQHLEDLRRHQQHNRTTLEQQYLKQRDLREQQANFINQQSSLTQQITVLEQQLDQWRTQIQALEQHLSQEKSARDRLERQYRQQQQDIQQLEWQQQKLQEEQHQRRDHCATLEQTLQEGQQTLPDPLPEIPPEVCEMGLVALQHQIRTLAKRIEAMEPVNMLALEEYDRTQTRLMDLTEKLETLASERTELLLRIENFTTLRQRAFMESFDRVNQNFKDIFAQLSEGDGYLQLDNPEDPLQGGLNLVAHPKGKPVRRLASMSGGEKSLTALSFIFALQRYRPSPFYAFDEVDSFLDGANVERLAKIIRQQASQAQFLVVSHRRPMIEAAERMIGVTQAKGSQTQVVGISF